MKQIKINAGGQSQARMVTLDNICRDVMPLWLDPAPSKATLRAWLELDHVERLKANPEAKRGGGTVFYGVADVERCLRGRMKRATMAITERAEAKAARSHN